MAEILPPLVNGRTHGFLEIKITELRLTRCFPPVNDLRVKLFWWGQNNPTYLSPLVQITKFKNVSTKTSKTTCSVTYEIQTDPLLFASYIDRIQVLELPVVSACDNYDVIGSVFIHKLTIAVLHSQSLTLPVVNHYGNRIGEMKLSFVYKEFNNTYNCNNMARGVSPDLYHIQESHDSPEKSASSRKLHLQNVQDNHKSPAAQYLNNSNISYQKPLGGQYIKRRTNCRKTVEYVPEKITLKDNSTVLNYKDTLNSDNIRRMPLVPRLDLSGIVGHENVKPIKITKRNVTHINDFKLKHKCIHQKESPKMQFAIENIVENVSKMILETQSPKTINKVAEHLSQWSENCFSSSKYSRLESDLKTEPVRKYKYKSGAKVVDYLLGKDMTMQDETEALSAFTQMSPSQHIAEPICDIYLRDTNQTHKNRYGKPVFDKSKFNLNDPIEKKYLEMLLESEHCRVLIANYNKNRKFTENRVDNQHSGNSTTCTRCSYLTDVGSRLVS